MTTQKPKHPMLVSSIKDKLELFAPSDWSQEPKTMKQSATSAILLFWSIGAVGVFCLPFDKNSESNLYPDEDTKNRSGYHPAVPEPPQLIQQYDRRETDGRHEFRYELTDGTCVYERSYWKIVGDGYRLLARKGFYSHPLPDKRYLTVFYTADDRGYQIDSSVYSFAKPYLPERIEIVPSTTPTPTSSPSTVPSSPPPPPIRNYIENNAAKVQLKTEIHQDIAANDDNEDEYVATVFDDQYF